MSELSAENHLFDSPAPERLFEYRPLESRRIRRARLQAAEVATELGYANPPIGAPIMRSAPFGVVLSDGRSAAVTESEPA